MQPTPLSSQTYIHLTDRAVIFISGNDAVPFLQKLITNDIHKVSEQQSIYALLLTPQGKFLYDFFVVKHADGFLIDIAKNYAAAFIQSLTMYRLRSQITFEVKPEYRVYAFLSPDTLSLRDAFMYQDPRHSDLGWRAIVTGDELSISLPLTEQNLDHYKLHCIRCLVPYSEIDLVSNHTYPHEVNMDDLNAIDYQKGCFVGQEVTARMHYKGHSKKQLIYVQSPDHQPLPPTGMEYQSADRKLIGIYGSSVGEEGLVLVRKIS